MYLRKNIIVTHSSFPESADPAKIYEEIKKEFLTKHNLYALEAFRVNMIQNISPYHFSDS
jgi:hypothetical protein